RTDFAVGLGVTHAVRVLHLADLHFGWIAPPAAARRRSSGKRSTAHFFVKKNEPDPSRLARILTEDPELSDTPDAVVVAGDVGWSGQDEDYEIAARFFEALTVSWPSAELVVAPGNHDLQRTAPEPRAAQDAFVALLQ